MSKPSAADAELVLRLYEIRRDPELRKARQWLISDFKATSWGRPCLSGCSIARNKKDWLPCRRSRVVSSLP